MEIDKLHMKRADVSKVGVQDQDTLPALTTISRPLARTERR